jgi:hypothetical protein
MRPSQSQKVLSSLTQVRLKESLYHIGSWILVQEHELLFTAFTTEKIMSRTNQKVVGINMFRLR